MTFGHSVCVAGIAVACVSAVPVRAQRASAPASAPPASNVTVTVLSPGADTYVSGRTLLRAALAPSGTVTNITFYADGRVVCTIARPPFQCDWDAGSRVVEHQIRVVATLANGARAVGNVRTKGAPYAESVDVNAVQVTATVTDGRGHYVTKLPRSAFHVFEDGKPQTITYFASEEVPLDLVVAVDISGSMVSAMSELKVAVKEFVRTVAANDRVTLIAFNDSMFTVAKPGADAAEWTRAFDRLTAWGGTSLYDVVIRGVDMLGTRPGRKAMIVFTDGEDENSHAPIEEVERWLQASDVTLYMIGQGRGISLDALKKVMQRLAQPTGGRALFTDKIGELHDAFAELLQELSNQYLLSYVPTNIERGDKIRRIKVEVDGRYQVRARQGYRASPVQ